MLGDERLYIAHLFVHVLQLFKRLLKFFASRRILSTCCNKLDSVEAGLFVQVVEQFDDLVKFV